MLNRIKNYILNLIGIDAIIPKGTAYIVFDKKAMLLYDKNGPGEASGLTTKNLCILFDFNNGRFMMRPDKGHDAMIEVVNAQTAQKGDK